MLTTTAPAATNYTIGLRKALAAIALALAVDCGMSREATAQSTYYTTTGSTGAWNTSRWSTSSGGPFNSAYGSGTAVAVTFIMYGSLSTDPHVDPELSVPLQFC